MGSGKTASHREDAKNRSCELSSNRRRTNRHEYLRCCVNLNVPKMMVESFTPALGITAPVLHPEPRDALELSHVRDRQRKPIRQTTRREPKVVKIDGKQHETLEYRFDPGCPPRLDRQLDSAMDSVHQFARRDDGKEELFFFALRQIGLDSKLAAFAIYEDAGIDQDSHGFCGGSFSSSARAALRSDANASVSSKLTAVVTRADSEDRRDAKLDAIPVEHATLQSPLPDELLLPVSRAFGYFAGRGCGAI